MKSRTRRLGALLLISTVLAVALATVAAAATIQLVPSKDNTMYEDWPDRSNGAGDGIYVGKTMFTEALRRGLIAFDLSAIPAGSTINAAFLQLEVAKAWPVFSTVGVHRVGEDWGEAGSNGSGDGATAEIGDATWSHRVWPANIWSTAGGDFNPLPSATHVVDIEGTYVWTGPGLAADVQLWLDNPASNFGWLLKGDEVTLQTAKKFFSREGATPPKLTIDFTPHLPGLSPPGQVAMAIIMIAVALPLVRRRRRTPA